MPKSTPKILPTQAELHRLLEYREETGQLVRKARPKYDFKTGRDCNAWNTCFAGKVAGYARRDGYVIVRVNKIGSLAHRLIWTMINGPIPDGLHIDHINGNPTDNRLENLRLVTHAVNCRNQRARARNTSGAHNVTWHKHTGKWKAEVGGKYLGVYSSKEEAALVAANYRKENGYSERHGNA